MYVYNTTTGDARASWAYGLRDPFTSAFRPGRSLMLINEVGMDTWEEIVTVTHERSGAGRAISATPHHEPSLLRSRA